MKKIILDFYNEIARKKAFWLPLLILVISAYAFGMLNRTISWDDFGREKYVGEGNVMLAGRWGMVLWSKITGTIDLNPFTDRFLAAIFLVIASVLACLVFFSLSKKNKVWSYTILASSIVTYPLINEIWEYSGADFISCGNMCLVTLALLFVLCRTSCVRWYYWIVPSLLLLLPASSYESAIFYYLTFVAIVIFYKAFRQDKRYTIKSFFQEGLSYCIPLVVAVLLRFVIGFVLLKIYNLSYNHGGATMLFWDLGNLFGTIKLLVLRSGFFYGIVGLVYLPISLFVICLLVFICMVVWESIKKKKWAIIGFGSLVIVAVFFQAIVQGSSMPYRTATISLALFEAFIFYSICEVVLEKKCVYPCVVVCLLLVCWHQSIYINKLQSLNNLRSDNELSALRHMGYKLSSEYDTNKPIVFVTYYKSGEWINKRIRVRGDSWNERLFLTITKILMGEKASDVGDDDGIQFEDYRYVKDNLKCITRYYMDIVYGFEYLGFDLNILKPASDETQEEYAIFEMAIKTAREAQLKPYSILETDDIIIATLSSDMFFDCLGYGYIK